MYVILSILIGCIVGSVFVYIFRRTEDNKTSNMRHKTALYTAKPAEKTTPVQGMMRNRYRVKHRK